MRYESILKRVMRDKAAPLIIILIVFTIFTMVVSSGVLDGEPLSSMFTKGFMTSGNLLGVFYNMVIRIVMMCGIACIFIGGNIDLSVGAQASLATMVFAMIVRSAAFPWPVAVVLTLMVAACFGLANTFLVNFLKFPPFIATIGMASVYTGICKVVTEGENIQISQQKAGLFLEIGKAHIFGRFPVIFIFAVLLVAAYQFMLSKTTFGRSIYMCGGNPGAARLSGLNPDKIRMILFINNSVLAAVAGLLWTSQLKLASPTAIINAAPDLQVISAAILGGISFGGGGGHLGGALVAVLLLGVFDNMLSVLGVQSYWNVFAQGLLLAVALIFDYISTERRRKALLLRG
ncbi:MAG: ABC transporter permease [Peptococcaceae bacterium]|nr:ABC transporter permease [Peptococcaceae bacterium]